MRWLAILLVIVPLSASAGTITWTNDGGDGWDDGAGENWSAADINAVKTAVDDNDSAITALEARDTIAEHESVETVNVILATGGSATTLVDSGAGWTTDEWVDAVVRITSGTGIDQTRRVISNTATTLTVAAWGTNPVSGSGYALEHYVDPATGFCDVANGAECESAAAGSTTDYSIYSLPLRVQIPSFIAGRRLTGFRGEPTVYPNIGRQRGEPWSTL